MKKSTTVFLAAGLLAGMGLSARAEETTPAPVATVGTTNPETITRSHVKQNRGESMVRHGERRVEHGERTQPLIHISKATQPY